MAVRNGYRAGLKMGIREIDPTMDFAVLPQPNAAAKKRAYFALVYFIDGDA